jgi:hypothetical protein
MLRRELFQTHVIYKLIFVDMSFIQDVKPKHLL